MGQKAAWCHAFPNLPPPHTHANSLLQSKKKEMKRRWDYWTKENKNLETWKIPILITSLKWGSEFRGDTTGGVAKWPFNKDISVGVSPEPNWLHPQEGCLCALKARRWGKAANCLGFYKIKQWYLQLQMHLLQTAWKKNFSNQAFLQWQHLKSEFEKL